MASVDRGTCGLGIEPRKLSNRGADAVPLRGRQHRVRRHRETCPDPARSQTPGTHGNTLHGTREVPPLALRRTQGPHGESYGSTTVMHDDGKSDKPVVPRKDANNGGGNPPRRSAWREGALAKGNPGEQSRFWTQGQFDLQHALDPIRRAAMPMRHDPRQEPGAVVPHAGICAGGGPQGPSLPRPVTVYLTGDGCQDHSSTGCNH